MTFFSSFVSADSHIPFLLFEQKFHFGSFLILFGVIDPGEGEMGLTGG